MHIKSLPICALVFLLVSIPCFSQGNSANAGCALTGSWYGGDPAVPFPYYRVTFTPLGGERFLQIAEYTGDKSDYVGWSNWAGEYIKSGPHSYTGMLSSMWLWNPDSVNKPDGVDAGLPEMDFVRIQKAELIDCNTIRISYDVVAVYFNFTYDTVPLVTPPSPPGFALQGDELIVEVYHRMPASVSSDILSTSLQMIGKPHKRK